MVAETAVDEFRLCLKTLKLGDVEMDQQKLLLETILGVKEDQAEPESAKAIQLLEKFTDALMRLTINITRSHEAKMGYKRTTTVKVSRRNYSCICDHSERSC